MARRAGFAGKGHKHKVNKMSPADRLLSKRRNNKTQYDKQRAAVYLLKNVPCADCGGRFPPECMDFDHIASRGVKVAPVARLMARSPLKVVLAEADKCEVVCSNCHRIRTSRRRVA